jgi:long-chain acyl-CoA synthetase
MVSPRSPAAELQRRFDEVDPALVIVGAATTPSLPAGVDVVRPAGSSATDAQVLEAEPQTMAITRADGPAVVLYTSGVSGLPQPVVLTYGNLAATSAGLIASPGAGLDHSTVAYGGLPLAHVFGLNSVIGTVLRAGGKVILHEGFDPLEVAELVAQYRVTTISAVPLMWKGLAAVGSRELFSTVTRATYAAASLSSAMQQSVEDKLGLALAGGFGLTETAGTICHDDPTSPHPGTVGRPLGETEIRVLDGESDALLGDFGEIWVRGPSVARAHLDGSPLDATDDGWLRTGDIGVLDDQGLLEIVDRKKDVINISGFNVSPAEVEQALSVHPGVGTSVVVGEADDDREVVVAHVVPSAGSSVTEADLLDHCRAQLSRYKVPTRIFLHTELPLTESGKAVRRLLGKTA